MTRIDCKHLYMAEGWRHDPGTDYLEEPKTEPILEGVPVCSIFVNDREKYGDMPPWADRSLPGSGNFRYPSDCLNCPCYEADPIKVRLHKEKNNET